MHFDREQGAALEKVRAQASFDLAQLWGGACRRPSTGAAKRPSMPLGQQPPPGHPSKPGRRVGPASSSKPQSPDSEDCLGQDAKTVPALDCSKKSCHSSSEVEKDSGFSDVSSEYLSTVEQTDTDDQSTSSLRRPAKLQRAPQNASGGLPGSTFTGLAPVYLVKNVALKQPLGPSTPAQFLTWSSQHTLDSLQGSHARVVFIQQPLAALKPLLPGQRSAAKEPCLPSLSTYPKIAPHPGYDQQAKTGLEPAPAGGSSSKNKRFCLGEAWVSSSKTPAPKCGREKQGAEPLPPASSDPPVLAAVGPEALSQNTVSSSTNCEMPSLDQAEVRMISRASKKLGFSSPGKQRRFHNTVEILRKSGLLGITLRTKELIRQNSSTQRDLAELQEHAQLLCEAVQGRDSNAWTRLQEAMSRSAAYWASKGASAYPLQGQTPVAEAASSSALVTRESPPGSPLNLSVVPDTSVGAALP